MLTNYSKCHFKKRPVYFNFEDSEIKDEPENLCIKKEAVIDYKLNEINIKKEITNTVPHNIVNHDDYDDRTSSVIIPTPTYPKMSIQPWSFHLPYSPNFNRTHISTPTNAPLHSYNHHHHHHHNQHHPQQHYHPQHHHHHHNHHHQQQQHNQYLSPLRSDLHSPSSPSEGSMSPPPHYLHGRANSVSPPIRELYYPSIGTKQNSHIIRPGVIPSQRFIPYQVRCQQYPLSLNHQTPPISPTYSETSSYYSMRSQTPESNCSAPEDLSIKQISSTSSSLTSPSNIILNENCNTNNINNNDNNNNNISETISIKEKISPPRYQCTDCNKSYSTFSGLTKHQQFHCPAAEGNQVKKSFSCKDCDKTYVSLGALKMHIRTHTLPCKCTFCGKAFSRPWLLQGHIRTHTGEKPFSCQHCHRAFADRSNLRAHLQTHSDIKKYSCTTCSKTFSRMSLLTKHNDGGCPGINGSLSPPYNSSFQEH